MPVIEHGRGQSFCYMKGVKFVCRLACSVLTIARGRRRCTLARTACRYLCGTLLHANNLSCWSFASRPMSIQSPLNVQCKKKKEKEHSACSSHAGLQRPCLLLSLFISLQNLQICLLPALLLNKMRALLIAKSARTHAAERLSIKVHGLTYCIG